MTLVIALTGTPGTGKTATARLLEGRGYSVVDLNALAETSGVKGDYDEERDTWEVDIDALEDILSEKEFTGNVILEGHWSHEFSCDIVVCLRCEPDVLRTRLSGRDYSDEKIDENVWAEALSIIVAEAHESEGRVEQIDTTEMGTEEVADLFERIVGGEVSPPVSWLDWLMAHT